MPLISATTLSAISAPRPPPWRSEPRSFTTTLAPSRAKSSACSRPMPPPAPVTIATLPSSRPAMAAPPSEGAVLSTKPVRRSAARGAQFLEGAAQLLDLRVPLAKLLMRVGQLEQQALDLQHQPGRVRGRRRRQRLHEFLRGEPAGRLQAVRARSGLLRHTGRLRRSGQLRRSGRLRRSGQLRRSDRLRRQGPLFAERLVEQLLDARRRAVEVRIEVVERERGLRIE